MIFIDLLAWVILIFLSLYVLLQLYIISCSSKGRIADIERRNYFPKYHQNINVIVYSHNNAESIVHLIEALKKQDYDKDKYSINVILDNCDDNSAKVLEIVGGARLWRISTDIKPIGKYKAYAWLLERILSSENTNAFVFLDANCIVKPDFLSKVNSVIFECPVLIGEALPLNQKLNLMSNLVLFRNRIRNRVFNHGRYYASLSNILDGEVFAIRQDILEKVKFPIIDWGFEEYEFSIKLSRAQIPVSYSYQLSVYKQYNETLKSIADYDYCKRYKSLITFKNNLALLFNRSSLRTKELLLSLLYPSSTTFIILSFLLIVLSGRSYGLYASFISFKAPLILLLGFLTGKFFASIVSRNTLQDYKNGIIWLFISPLILLASLLSRFKININLKINFSKKVETKKETRKTIEATVTDGRKELPCQVEIRQTDYYNQVVFIFNNKKLATSKHQRIDYALDELVEKLKNHGFALKVCLNCGYFKFDEDIAPKFEGEQGYCLFDNVNKESKSKEYSFIWNSCQNIIPKQARNHILNEFNKLNKD